MLPKRWSISRSLVIGSLVSLVWMGLAVAQKQDFRAQGNEVELTEAEVCELQNNVKILRHQEESSDSAEPPSAKLKDILRPKDALRTAIDALAELLFNEGSYVRVDKDSIFRFLTGKRRVEQLPNSEYLISGCENRGNTENKLKTKVQWKSLALRKKHLYTAFGNPIAQTSQSSTKAETIFGLERGRALIVSIPNSSIAKIETPQSLINVRASAPAATSGLLPPLQQSGAVLVEHNANTGTTEVFALTDDDIEVSDLKGGQTVSLLGGQKVAVRNGNVGEPEEFSLETAYDSDALLAGLGPGEKHDIHIAQSPTGVQFTLNLARARTLEALRNQGWRQRKDQWQQGFLGPIRNGFEPPPESFRPVSSRDVINPEVTPGVFVRTGENTATFTDGDGNVTDISVDFDNRSIAIDGESGISNNAGLSGNNALGTVNLENGRLVRIEVFGVGGEEPDQQVPFQGTLTEGLAPDR